MKKFVLLFTLLTMMFLQACTSAQTSANPTPTQAMAPKFADIEINATDFSFESPQVIQDGWVRVTLKNSGAEPHHVQFLKLNDGVTFQQFTEALQQGEGPALSLVSLVGGVGAIAPGLTASALLNLPAGEYVLLCLIPSADQMPHFVKGMIKTIKVEHAANQSPEPQSTLSVNLKDFSFDLPDTLPASEFVMKVTNEGPEFHELNLAKLADGKTKDDVLNYLMNPNGPPPFIPVGGMNGLGVGSYGYLEVALAPGNYIAICNIPSPQAEGHPHFTLGMIKEFTVK